MRTQYQILQAVFSTGSYVLYLAMIRASHPVEVRVKGRWITIPAMEVFGDILIATGRQLKIARIRGEEMKENEVEAPERYIEALTNDKDRILNADIFTFTQNVPATQPRYPYCMEWESVAAIPLVSFHKWWESLPQETRKNVRRSQKRGVVITVKNLDADVVEGIRSVNDDSSLRQGVKNAYYGLTPEETWKRYGEFNGRCNFVCAYSGDEMIGFLHLVYRDKIAAILNLTVKPSESDKRPANALIAKAVEICESQNMKHITYGLYNYGNKRDDSLREFKIRNGFQELPRPRYFVPISWWGSLCMRAKLHRGLVGILPGPVISAGVRVRALWFRKFPKPV